MQPFSDKERMSKLQESKSGRKSAPRSVQPSKGKHRDPSSVKESVEKKGAGEYKGKFVKHFCVILSWTLSRTEITFCLANYRIPLS